MYGPYDLKTTLHFFGNMFFQFSQKVTIWVHRLECHPVSYAHTNRTSHIGLRFIVLRCTFHQLFFILRLGGGRQPVHLSMKPIWFSLGSFLNTSPMCIAASGSFISGKYNLSPRIGRHARSDEFHSGFHGEIFNIKISLWISLWKKFQLRFHFPPSFE